MLIYLILEISTINILNSLEILIFEKKKKLYMKNEGMSFEVEEDLFGFFQTPVGNLICDGGSNRI